MTNDSLIQLLVTHAVQIAVVALLAFILTSAIRRHSRLCWAIWLVVLVKCVTPPVIGHQVSLFQWTDRVWNTVAYQWQDSERALETTSRLPVEAVTTTGTKTAVGDADAVSSLNRLHAVSANVTVRQLGEMAFIPQTAANSTSWAQWLLIAFGGLSGCSFLLLFVRYVGCLKQLCRAETSEFDDRVQRLLDEIAAQLSLKKLPRIMVTDAKFGPAVIGVFRPLIVLPRILVQQLDDDTLKPVIAHEVIHIRRGDLFVGMLQAVAHCLWWFHPFVWLINRQISRVAEQCCDQQVLIETNCSARQYAQSLLAVIECRSRLVPVPVFPGMKPVEITQQRLEKIMTQKQGSFRRSKIASLVTVVVMSALVLPSAMTATGQQEAKEWKPLPDTQTLVPSLYSDSAKTSSAIVYQKYEVSSLVAQMCDELQITQLDATLIIQQKLRLAAKSRQPQLAGTEMPLHFVIEPHAKGTYEWNLGTTTAGHEAVAEALKLLRAYGFAQIKIRATILSAPQAVMSETLQKTGIKVEPAVTRQQESGIQFGLMQLNSSHPGIKSHTQPSTIAPVAFSETRIRQAVSIATAIIAEEAADRFVASAKSHQMVTLLSSPQVITFNGHDASVSTGESRPYVLGYHQGQPQVQIVNTGLGVSVTPRLGADGLQLSCGITISEVLNAAGIEASAADDSTADDSSGDEVEIPEVKEQTVRANVSLQPRQNFVVTGLTRNTKDGELEEVVVLLEAERFLPAPPVASVPKADEQRLTLRAYQVADLVVPISNQLMGSDAAEQAKPPLPALKSKTAEWTPRFEKQVPIEAIGEAAKLIELIRTTVSRESWKPTVRGESWGKGIMSFDQNTMILVIRQTPKVHDQIIDLLNSLRRQKDRQIATNIWSIATSAKFQSGWSDGLRFTEARPGFSWAMATSDQIEMIGSVLKKSRQHISASVPVNVTAYDQQMIHDPIKFDENPISDFSYSASILGGGKLVKVNATLTAASSIDADADSRSLSAILSSGTTLVLRYRPSVTVGVPLLEDIPAVSKLFTNRSATADGEDVYVFLTPRVLDVSGDDKSNL
ncbi:MAG: M56 family metallopeptidase [Fuerstiella sp.]